MTMRRFQKIGRAIRRPSSQSSPVSFTCRGRPICRDKLFEYTNGRFLVNEGDALRRRYLNFDVDELCAIASNVGSNSPVHAVEKMEGGFSKALLMKKMDGSEVVAKLPFPIAGPPKYTTAAEVAVLQYVHQHTKVPVPKVLAWSSDSSNLVGAEYIIMEKAAGTQLVKKWHEMRDQSHFLLIKNLCALEAELASIPFPVNGTLYLRESMTDGEDHTLLDSNVDPSGQFCIGPSCDRAWDTTDVDREDKGPWHGVSAFGHAIVQRELSRIRKSEKAPAATYIPQKGTTEDQTSILDLTREIMRRMDANTLPGKCSRPALWHTDMHFGNIYVSNEDPTNIVSLIDWQGIVIAPLFYQVRFPEFLDVSEDYIVGGPIPRLPENLDHMDPDDQDIEKFEHKQACMAKAYEAASGFKDMKIYWALQTPSYFKELFVRAGQAWEEGIIPLRACLIEISKGWEEAGFVGECPISFSTEQINEHEDDFQEYSNFHSVQEIARKYLDTDTEGWLSPSEDFAQKHQQNKELLQLVMDTSAKYGMSPEEVKRIWPF